MSLILTPLATPRQVRNTPSSQDGIPPDLEADLRAFGAQLIQEAGTLAQLCVPPPALAARASLLTSGCHLRPARAADGRPQVAMATAQVLFQRFWFVSSLRQFGIRVSSPPWHLSPPPQLCQLPQALTPHALPLVVLRQDVGMGALYLATKLEECPLRLVRLRPSTAVPRDLVLERS